MIASLLFPDLPAFALQMALDTRKQLLVFSAGRVVAPYELAGMPIDRARTLRPYACPLTRQPALEKAAWDHILESVFAFTPYISEVSAGKLFCTPNNMSALRSLVGVTQARVGLARTRTMALLASLAAKPGGMVTVDDDDISLFLDELPVSVLTELDELELGDTMIQRLSLYGLSTVGRIRRLTRPQLQAQFGTVGLQLHQLLHSITDHTQLPLYVPAPEININVPSYIPSKEPGDIEVLLQEALVQAIVQLGNQRCGRAKVSLYNRDSRMVATTSRVLRASTADPRHLLTQTTTMLHNILTGADEIAELSLCLSSLSLTPPTQTVLFRRVPNSADVNKLLSRRFPQVVKAITVVDKDAYLPDRFASIDQWKPAAS